MTFSSNRLVVDPTLRRSSVATTILRIINVIPGEAVIKVVDGVLASESTAPEVEGQLIVQWVDGVGNNKTMRLWVAVDIEGTLTWKMCLLYTTKGRYTTGNVPVMGG